MARKIVYLVFKVLVYGLGAFCLIRGLMRGSFFWSDWAILVLVILNLGLDTALLIVRRKNKKDDGEK